VKGEGPETPSTQDALNWLAVLYGHDSEWLQVMAIRTPAFFQGFAKLGRWLISEGALPLRIKELILAVIYATQGFRYGVETHIENAKKAGATDDEIAEMLAAALLSRGVRAYVEGFAGWLSSASLDEIKTSSVEHEPVRDTTTREIVKYFDSYYGQSLPHVRILAESGHDDVLQAYYCMRSYILNDVALPRKYKECLYIAINVADRNIGAVKIHGKGAIESGASGEEVLEAMLVAIMAGGFIAWVDVAATYEEIISGL